MVIFGTCNVPATILGKYALHHNTLQDALQRCRPASEVRSGPSISMMMVVKESGIGAGWANTTLHDLPRLINMASLAADQPMRTGGLVEGAIEWQPRRAERKSAYPHVPTDQWDSIEDTTEAGGSVLGARILFQGRVTPKSGCARPFPDCHAATRASLAPILGSF